MKKFFLDCGTRDATASLGLLVLRVFTGLFLFLGHGLGKIQNFSGIKDGFPVPDFFPLKYLSPPISLASCMVVEVGFAILLMLGLFTRPAAFLIAFTMVVAAFNIHGSGPWFIANGQGAKELALLYLVPAITILLTGAGIYSIDSKVYKGDRRRRW